MGGYGEAQPTSPSSAPAAGGGAAGAAGDCLEQQVEAVSQKNQLKNPSSLPVEEPFLFPRGAPPAGPPPTFARI